MAGNGWHDGELEVQRRAGVLDHERLRKGVRDALPPHFVDFLAVQRFVVIGTEDGNGRLWCWMVAGWPGFATALDPFTVSLDRRAFADDDLLRAIDVQPRIGLLAIDPSTRRRIRVNGGVTIGDAALTLHLEETFGNCRQYVQMRPADGPAPRRPVVQSSGTRLDARHRDWIATADTCFVATAHAGAGPDASHRGGRPGFVEVADDRVLRFADYPGNNMFQTLGNIVANPAAAMLFVDFETGATLQLSGQAALRWNRDGSPTGREVEFTVRELVEKRPETPWSWPVVEYSPVNP